MRYLYCYVILSLFALSLGAHPPKSSACGFVVGQQRIACEAGCPTSSDPQACKHACLKAYNEAIVACRNSPPGQQ